jgi:AhpD family alkylhydroperoxidase
MEARLDLQKNEFFQKFYRKYNAAGQALRESTLPHGLVHLVLLRASQINGCGFCTDMHTKDALADGDTFQRLSLVAAWREATVFTEPERAALALTEEATRIADAAPGVSDAVWGEARKHFDDDQLAALIAAIVIINGYNRVNVIVESPAGWYEPGMFD